jgi:hypothetical protein
MDSIVNLITADGINARFDSLIVADNPEAIISDSSSSSNGTLILCNPISSTFQIPKLSLGDLHKFWYQGLDHFTFYFSKIYYLYKYYILVNLICFIIN